jgi:indolepyruvate ferredoxin oxidoreductase
MERELIREYEESIERLLGGLTAQNHALALQIASAPEEMRGFGYIKKRNVEAARKKRDELLARFGAVPAPERAAA